MHDAIVPMIPSSSLDAGTMIDTVDVLGGGADHGQVGTTVPQWRGDGDDDDVGRDQDPVVGAELHPAQAGEVVVGDVAHVGALVTQRADLDGSTSTPMRPNPSPPAVTRGGGPRSRARRRSR